MAISQLHGDIKKLARNKPALVIEASTLNDLALDSLITASDFANNTVPMLQTGHTGVAGRLLQLSIDPRTLTAGLIVRGTDLLIGIDPGFTIQLELFEPTTAAPYSTVVINVPPVEIPLIPGRNAVAFAQPEVLVTATVTDSPQRQAAIASSGITVDDLLRVEGSIAFGGSSRLVRSVLGELPPIDLEKLFPAFKFGGDLEFHEIRGALIVIPQWFEFIGNTGCPKGDATDGVEVAVGSPTMGQDGGSWPIPTKLRKAPRRPQPQLSGSLVAAYLPKPILDMQFGKVAPAITYRDNGYGFIGYHVELSASIQRIAVSIDVAERALRLELSFVASGFARATIDVPCVGRVELAQAHMSLPKPPGVSTVSVLVRLGIDSSGRLIMLTEIERIDLGDAEVNIQLFSKYLGMAGGKAAVIGFIIDAVLGRVIAHNLPKLVIDVIKDTVNQHFFVLADMSDLLKYVDRAPNGTTWSGEPGSVLMGMTNLYGVRSRNSASRGKALAERSLAAAEPTR